MLSSLYISNYALIDELEINFDQGFTILTGETGAGKSIILGALSLILGERAEIRSIRNKDAKTVVEATFDLTHFSELGDFFTANSIDFFEKECIVRRELSPSGRSRAFINDTPVNVSILKELTSQLIDIHSQHSNMLLSSAQFQLSVLDHIAGNGELLSTFAQEFKHYQTLKCDLEALQASYNQSKQEEDYICFQLEQLQSLALQENEDNELEARQQKLANVTEIKDCLWTVNEALDREENSIIDQLSTLSHQLSVAEKNLSEIEGLSERIESVVIELKDIAHTVAITNSELSDDPQTLAETEERLSNIYAQERKHSVDSVNELLEIQHRFEAQIATINNSDEAIAQKKIALEKQLKVLTLMAQQLSKARRQAATKFIAALKHDAQALGMKNLQFSIDFQEIEVCATGTDNVDFLFAFNKSQELMPVKNTASGGEISRLMLCIKSIIAKSMNLPTIVFDEVDTGVSGDIANRIGGVMKEMSQHIQVMSITHLPQVAAHGNQHLMVYKEDTGNTTLTHVKTLSSDEHVLEVARMLSGENINEASINNAKSLIEHCR